MIVSLCSIRSRALAAVAVSASLAVLWGQTTTSLRGTITDAQGAVIESATVSLLNSQVGFRRTVLADATGTYQFLQVPPGKYSVSIEKPGFTSVTQQNVELLVNTPATMDVSMQVAAVASTVNVEAEVTTINTVDASVGDSFNQTQVRQLPL